MLARVLDFIVPRKSTRKRFSFEHSHPSRGGPGRVNLTWNGLVFFLRLFRSRENRAIDRASFSRCWGNFPLSRNLVVSCDFVGFSDFSNSFAGICDFNLRFMSLMLPIVLYIIFVYYELNSNTKVGWICYSLGYMLGYTLNKWIFGNLSKIEILD